jgi:hypothetical protein
MYLHKEYNNMFNYKSNSKTGLDTKVYSTFLHKISLKANCFDRYVTSDARDMHGNGCFVAKSPFWYPV